MPQLKKILTNKKSISSLNENENETKFQSRMLALVSGVCPVDDALPCMHSNVAFSVS